MTVWPSLGVLNPQWQQHKGHTAVGLLPSSPAAEIAATAAPRKQDVVLGGWGGCCSGLVLAGKAVAAVQLSVPATNNTRIQMKHIDN